MASYYAIFVAEIWRLFRALSTSVFQFRRPHPSLHEFPRLFSRFISEGRFHPVSLASFSGRSRRYGAEGKFRAFSAGSMPSRRINPLALELLKSLDYDTSQLRSKSWDEFEQPGAPVFDFIFTVCDNAAHEVCPIWPGHPMTVHWGIEDPSAAQGTEAERRFAFSEAYRMLFERIGAFVHLPIDSLEPTTLKRRLAEIGAMDGSTTMAKA